MIYIDEYPIIYLTTKEWEGNMTFKLFPKNGNGRTLLLSDREWQSKVTVNVISVYTGTEISISTKAIRERYVVYDVKRNVILNWRKKSEKAGSDV